MEIKYINKIDSHVEFFEGFTTINILDFGDVVKCEIDILEFFEFGEIFHFLNDVILQI